MEISEANRSGGAAAPASSALVGVHSLLSSEQEMPITAADIIDVGLWSDGVERAGFKALTSKEWRLLAIKLQSSQNVKVLNLSGNSIRADMMRSFTDHLGMLTSLQEIDLRQTKIGDEGAGRLEEPLGKLTALLKLNLYGMV
jgi:Leucine-rich repeat (LRR) protein